MPPAPRVPTPAISRVRLRVANLDAMAAFFVGRLGVPVRAASDRMVTLDTEGPALELVAAADLPPSRTEVSFQVRDLAPVSAALADRGVPVVEGPTAAPWGEYLRFLDPEGNLWSVARSEHGFPDPGSRLGRVAWVVMTARDVPSLSRWYAETLGLPLAFEAERWASFTTAGGRLEIKRGEPGPGRHLHCLRVDPRRLPSWLAPEGRVPALPISDPDENRVFLEPA